MLAAMCAVLGALSVDFGNIKLTLESLPVMLGALLFGPVDGVLIGFVGTLLYQVSRYGLTVTTPLWVLPYVVCGLVMGLYAKKCGFALTVKKTIFVSVLANLLVTTLNTYVMYLDSKIFGYYSYAYIFGAIVVRYVVCVAKSVLFGVLLPPLTKLLRERLRL